MISISHWGIFPGRLRAVPKVISDDVLRFRLPSELAEVIIVWDEGLSFDDDGPISNMLPDE